MQDDLGRVPTTLKRSLGMSTCCHDFVVVNLREGVLHVTKSLHGKVFNIVRDSSTLISHATIASEASVVVDVRG